MKQRTANLSAGCGCGMRDESFLECDEPDAFVERQDLQRLGTRLGHEIAGGTIPRISSAVAAFFEDDIAGATPLEKQRRARFEPCLRQLAATRTDYALALEAR